MTYKVRPNKPTPLIEEEDDGDELNLDECVQVETEPMEPEDFTTRLNKFNARI